MHALISIVDPDGLFSGWLVPVPKGPPPSSDCRSLSAAGSNNGRIRAAGDAPASGTLHARQFACPAA